MSTVSSEQHCYLDHAAATPLIPQVQAAMRDVEGTFGNPSSPHAAGREARRKLEEARERIVVALGGEISGRHRDQLLFTSGATEANQTAVTGLQHPRADHAPVLYSARDHAGTAAAAQQLRAGGRAVTQLPLDLGGRLNREALSEALACQPAAVLSTTLACSQTGTLEDVAEIAAMHPALTIHVDAVQAVGRIPLDPDNLRAASLAVAAHKIGGPRGIGGLLLRHDSRLIPLLPGSQERGLRGGTEPVALATGFAVAVELAVKRQKDEARRLAGLRDRIERGIVSAARSAGIDAVVIGESVPRVPHISVIALPGRDRQATVIAADLVGICLASGTACSSGSSEPSPALAASGLAQEVVRSAVRVSLGWPTTEMEIDHAVKLLQTRVFTSSA
jgi:cysteine desulfurase